MNSARSLQGLSLKVGPLGECDRLITILSDKEGITRLAVPGARNPRSNLSAAAPLTLLELHVVGRSGLKKVRQLKVLRSYSKLGASLETLAAAQVLAELSLMLVGGNDPIPGLLSTLLIHLERLEGSKEVASERSLIALAQCVQASVHLLALGGYALPVQRCCLSGHLLEPPIGEWNWRCSFLPQEGFAIGSLPTSIIQLNPSELALLQRLLSPNLPKRSNGELLGPYIVWLKLLKVVEYWIKSNLTSEIRSLKILRESLIPSNDERS